MFNSFFYLLEYDLVMLSAWLSLYVTQSLRLIKAYVTNVGQHWKAKYQIKFLLVYLK